MKQLSTQEIIKNSDELKDMDYKWEDVYVAVYTSIQNNTHRVLRNNNTLLWLKLLPNKSAQMYIFNADPPKQFLRNMKEFAKALDKGGFDTVFGETHNKQIIEMLKRLGYPVDVEVVGQDDKGRTVYRGTVNV